MKAKRQLIQTFTTVAALRSLFDMHHQLRAAHFVCLHPLEPIRYSSQAVRKYFNFVGLQG